MRKRCLIIALGYTNGNALSGAGSAGDTVSPTTQNAKAGTDVTFAVTVAGSSPINLQWRLNGTNLNIPPSIQTVAGSFNGDGAAATNSCLAGPYGVALDAVGNIFIADTAHHVVRKIDANGLITTVAGNGVETFAGDE